MQCKSTITRLVSLCIVLAFCLMATDAVQAQEKEEILIGAPLSLSGPGSLQGVEQKWAYDQIFADTNKAGGIYVKKYGKKLPVKLLAIDDESDPNKAVGIIEKLIKVDKVDLLLSTQNDGMTLPCAIAVEKFHVYHHAAVCLKENWKPRKFRWSSDIFIDSAGLGETPFKILKSLPEAERPKRIGLYLMDNPAGEFFRRGFKKAAPEFGYSSDFPVDEPLTLGSKDYSSIILKGKDKKIDAVFIGALPEDSVTFLRQMKELNFRVPYFHGWAGTWASQFYEALGKDADYVLADGFWSPDFPYPGATELGERFQKEFKRNSVSVGLFYAQAQILFRAIENAGTLESAKVRDAVFGHEFKGTVMGDVKYDKDGFALIASLGMQWYQGQQKLVYPFFKGGWKTKLAPTSWQ
jgi:branched-chain amino acid transport system substrate-binding protein